MYLHPVVLNAMKCQKMMELNLCEHSAFLTIFVCADEYKEAQLLHDSSCLFPHVMCWDGYAKQLPIHFLSEESMQCCMQENFAFFCVKYYTEQN